MLDPSELPTMREAIRERTRADQKFLDELRADVRALAPSVRTIRPRSTTSVSLVASDGGNNKLQFDPFLIQFVRVVDSYGKQLCFDTISPTTDTDLLSAKQFNPDGTPRTALGRLMIDLGVTPRTLNALSVMIPTGEEVRTSPETVPPSWVLVYRDLCEWAVLYDRICYYPFATDTLLVRDGLLRSKLFRGKLFMDMMRLIEGAITRIQKEDKRKVYLVGIAKHSNVITRYQLAMSVEKTLPAGEARYVRVPRTLEAKVYVWPEYARGAEEEGKGGEAPKFVAGDMYLVRFGCHTGDPTWAVDILTSQSPQHAEIFGYLLADAIDGFPVPYYPRCLQKAHEHAQIVDFDLTILQDEIYSAVRLLLPDGDRKLMDAFRLKADPAGRRYE
jgi:hypothetical protein